MTKMGSIISHEISASIKNAKADFLCFPKLLIIKHCPLYVDITSDSSSTSIVTLVTTSTIYV